MLCCTPPSAGCFHVDSACGRWFSETSPFHIPEMPDTGRTLRSQVTDVGRRAAVLLGDAYVRIGNFDQARKAYATVNATEKLIALGDFALTKRNYREAMRAYTTAAAQDKLILLGDLCVDANEWHFALKAYEAAKAQEKLVSLGDAAFEQLRTSMAEEAYAIAGVAVPVERFIACGEKLAARKNFDDACYCFVRAHALEHLVEIGDRFVEIQQFNLALTAYTHAGARERLMALGDAAFTYLCPFPAWDAYRVAGATPPRARLIAAGQAFTARGFFNEARRCYSAAGDKKALVSIGDDAARAGDLDLAVAAYKDAGEPMPPDRLMTCGATALKRGWFEIARKAFSLANAPEKLVVLGDAAYTYGDYVAAYRAYEDAGCAVSVEKLLAVADALLDVCQRREAYSALLLAAKRGA